MEVPKTQLRIQNASRDLETGSSQSYTESGWVSQSQDEKDANQSSLLNKIKEILTESFFFFLTESFAVLCNEL